jgi:hypothetical protein
MFQIAKSYYQFLIGSTLFLLLLMSSCIKENIGNVSDNVMINQSFSVPLGLREVTLDAPPIIDTSIIPGSYGSYYYDGRIYPNDSLYFTKTYDIDFNLQDKRARQDWIKRLMFHLLIENSFPTQVYSQIYIYNASRVPTDSVFANGPVLVNAASVNSQGEIEQSSDKLFDVPFEGDRLTMLKQTTLLVYKGTILTQNGIRLSSKNEIKINIAIQVEVGYNLKDIAQ